MSFDPTSPTTVGKIDRLLLLGFPREDIVKCLRAAKGNEATASNYLLDGIPPWASLSSLLQVLAEEPPADNSPLATPQSSSEEEEKGEQTPILNEIRSLWKSSSPSPHRWADWVELIEMSFMKATSAEDARVRSEEVRQSTAQADIAALRRQLCIAVETENERTEIENARREAMQAEIASAQVAITQLRSRRSEVDLPEIVAEVVRKDLKAIEHREQIDSDSQFAVELQQRMNQEERNWTDLMESISQVEPSEREGLRQFMLQKCSFCSVRTLDCRRTECDHFVCVSCLDRKLEALGDEDEYKIPCRKRGVLNPATQRRGRCQGILSEDWLLSLTHPLIRSKILDKLRRSSCSVCLVEDCNRRCRAGGEKKTCSAGHSFCVYCEGVWDEEEEGEDCPNDECSSRRRDWLDVIRTMPMEPFQFSGPEGTRIGRIHPARLCPGCSHFVRRENDLSKCKHVHCSICSLHFCIVCLKRSNDTEGHHFPCGGAWSDCGLVEKQTAYPTGNSN